MGRLPKLVFPSFDGENPKIWISNSEKYFDMYRVDPAVWIKVASMHFSGSAAIWWQSVEKRLSQASWGEFGRLLLERFGRDQHELFIRQLFHIRQTGSVAEYVSKFSELVDQLVACGQQSNPLYYTTRFIDGLRDDIRASVILQRPATHDVAASLALLQEEVSDPRRHDVRRAESGYVSKFSNKSSGALSVPPKIDKSTVQSSSDKSAVEPNKSPSEKLKALKAYRRAQGLCERCAEKWSRDHRCSTSVQLHVLELFAEEPSLSEDSTADAPQDHLLAILAHA